MLQVLRHDIGDRRKVGTISEAVPHLVLHNLSSPLGQRVATILKFLFPTAKVRPARWHLCSPSQVGWAARVDCWAPGSQGRTHTRTAPPSAVRHGLRR